jgi:hypothetical protein
VVVKENRVSVRGLPSRSRKLVLPPALRLKE